MENYVKIYQRILQSSVWKLPSDIRIVWITILALKDAEGCVYGTPEWLADQAIVSDQMCQKAIKTFLAPDKRSRNGDHEGRKIEAIPGGWKVLNHFQYRDGMEIMRDKWRRQKEAQRSKLAPTKSLRQIVNERVNNDPITKADKASIRKLMAQDEKPIQDSEPTEFEKEYYLDESEPAPPPASEPQ